MHRTLIKERMDRHRNSSSVIGFRYLGRRRACRYIPVFLLWLLQVGHVGAQTDPAYINSQEPKKIDVVVGIPQQTERVKNRGITRNLALAMMEGHANITVTRLLKSAVESNDTDQAAGPIKAGDRIRPIAYVGSRVDRNRVEFQLTEHAEKKAVIDFDKLPLGKFRDLGYPYAQLKIPVKVGISDSSFDEEIATILRETIDADDNSHTPVTSII